MTTNPRDILQALVERADPELRAQLDLIVRTLPDTAVADIVHDLRTVADLLTRNTDDDTERARAYVARRYGAPGVLMLNQLLERSASGAAGDATNAPGIPLTPAPERPPGRLRYPSGDIADTSAIERVLPRRQQE